MSGWRGSGKERKQGKRPCPYCSRTDLHTHERRLGRLRIRDTYDEGGLVKVEQLQEESA